MDILISRQEAIDYIEKAIPVWSEDKEIAIDCLLNTTPVNHEEKTGRWVKIHGYATPGGDPVWACSKCGRGIHVYGIEASTYGRDIAEHQWVACPNCGARMKGETYE